MSKVLTHVGSSSLLAWRLIYERKMRAINAIGSQSRARLLTDVSSLFEGQRESPPSTQVKLRLSVSPVAGSVVLPPVMLRRAVVVRRASCAPASRTRTVPATARRYAVRTPTIYCLILDPSAEAARLPSVSEANHPFRLVSANEEPNHW